jgi:hypothetical protein
MISMRLDVRICMAISLKVQNLKGRPTGVAGKFCLEAILNASYN